jgi:O-antigen ligase
MIYVLGALAAAAIVGALMLAMRRRPDVFPLLAIFALPFRLPISTDGRTVNLLIPLYLVIGAGTLAQLIPRWLNRGTTETPRRRPIALEWLLLGAVVLYALQAIYSTDHTKAAENIAFFYIPFGLLFMLLRDVRWTRELILRCLGIAVALAVVFAGIGFVEYYRKTLFLNPKVIASDQYGNYFRVNSLFFDPNIYGRFLAIVMIAVTTIVLWARHRREVLIGAGVLAWLLAGLITSFSQSSIAALLLGMTVLAAYRWDVRATVYVAAALLAVVAVVVIAAPPSLHFGLKGSGGSTSNATSGRTKLIDGGLELFADRPLWGYGSGSFETEYRRHGDASAANAVSASHTIPITVAAEQGIIGLAVYVALLLAAFATLFRGAGRSPPRPTPGDTGLWPASPFRLALAACFAALVLHTWTYADFLEDPITWTLLGIGVALARQDVRRPAPADL